MAGRQDAQCTDEPVACDQHWHTTLALSERRQTRKLFRHLLHGKALRFTSMAVLKQQVGNLVLRRIEKRGGNAQHPSQILCGQEVRLVSAKFITVDPRAGNERINAGLDVQLFLCTDLYKDVNEKSGANVKWKIYPNAYHAFDGFAKWPFNPQAESAKNCSLEVFIEPKRAGLGEARNYKTGVAINSWDEWKAARKVTLLLTRVSGVPMLEATADKQWGADTHYQAYKARTPVLWPI